LQNRSVGPPERKEQEFAKSTDRYSDKNEVLKQPELSSWPFAHVEKGTEKGGWSAEEKVIFEKV
jgi:hypothetical protein